MSLSEKDVEAIAAVAVAVRSAITHAVQAGYRVLGVDGMLVASSGKFEGEPWYAPYYWDAALNGDGENIGGDDEPFATRIEVTRAERTAFSLADDVVSVLLWESDQGFVQLLRETKGERE